MKKPSVDFTAEASSAFSSSWSAIRAAAASTSAGASGRAQKSPRSRPIPIFTLALTSRRSSSGVDVLVRGGDPARELRLVLRGELERVGVGDVELVGLDLLVRGASCRAASRHWRSLSAAALSQCSGSGPSSSSPPRAGDARQRARAPRRRA